MTILDLDVAYYPCPAGGPTWRQKVKQKGGKASFPYMVDPNTGSLLIATIGSLSKGGDMHLMSIPLAGKAWAFGCSSCLEQPAPVLPHDKPCAEVWHGLLESLFSFPHFMLPWQQILHMQLKATQSKFSLDGCCQSSRSFPPKNEQTCGLQLEFRLAFGSPRGLSRVTICMPWRLELL